MSCTYKKSIYSLSAILLILTLCLYLFSAFLAFDIKRFSSVSSLNDTTKACGTHKLTRGANIFGTNCKDIVGGPLEEIL